MMKQLVFIGIVVILVCVSFSGCNSTPSTPGEKVIGKWKSTTYNNGVIFKYNPYRNYTFFSNGTYCRNIPGSINKWCSNYTITDTQLILTAGGGNKDIFEYTFSNENRTLELTDVNNSSLTYILEKQ